MKIINRMPVKTADASAERRTAGPELLRLCIYAAVLGMAVYFLIGVLADFCVARISFEQEAALFSASIFDGMVDSSEDTGRLERAKTILAAMTANDGVPPLDYRLVLVEEEAPNAFAFPGGTIGLTTGLLDALKEDMEIAFVLGHEIGHFNNRDHLRGMGRAVGVGLLYVVLFDRQMGDQLVSGVFNCILMRGYSRGQEEKADEYGVNLVHQTYGHTDGIERLFQIIQENDGKIPNWAYMFSTHPSPAQRIEDLKRYALSLAAPN